MEKCKVCGKQQGLSGFVDGVCSECTRQGKGGNTKNDGGEGATHDGDLRQKGALSIPAGVVGLLLVCAGPFGVVGLICLIVGTIVCIIGRFEKSQLSNRSALVGMFVALLLWTKLFFRMAE